MRSKILFCLSCLFSMAVSAQDNYLAGTWKGTMAIGYNSPIFTVDISIRIKQDGRLVWGIYTIGNHTTIDSCNCGGKLTTQLNKKNNFLINLYQNGIIHNGVTLDSCSSLNYFQASYSKDGNEEILKGRWFANPTYINEGTSGFINLGSSVNPVRAIMPINPIVYNNDGPYDGSGGRIVLKKISTTIDIDIDHYFAKSQK